jgi:hypothetical protein
MKIAELAGNKLSVLFFAQALGIPLTNEQITEFFIKTYFLNYFDLQHILAELVESQHLVHMEGRQNPLLYPDGQRKGSLGFFQNPESISIPGRIFWSMPIKTGTGFEMKAS